MLHDNHVNCNSNNRDDKKSYSAENNNYYDNNHSGNKWAVRLSGGKTAHTTNTNYQNWVNDKRQPQKQQSPQHLQQQSSNSE